MKFIRYFIHWEWNVYNDNKINQHTFLLLSILHVNAYRDLTNAQKLFYIIEYERIYLIFSAGTLLFIFANYWINHKQIEL